MDREKLLIDGKLFKVTSGPGDKASNNDQTPTPIIIKQEVKQEVLPTDNDPSCICRVCLNPGDIPLFGGKKYEDQSECLAELAGIEVDLYDNYPKHLCTGCNKLLKAAIKLVKTAQQSNTLLKRREIALSADHSYDNSFENVTAVEEITENEIVYFDDMNTDVIYELDIGEPEEQVVSPSSNQEANVSVKVEQVDSNSNRKCPHCHEYFTDNDLIKHIDTHQVDMQAKSTCPYCNRLFKNSYIKTHIREHQIAKTYICEHCSKVFMHKGNFDKHRSRHLDIFPFQCEHCPYRAKSNSSLNIHQKLHTEEPKFECDECGKKFLFLGNFKKHLLTHRPERDFPCVCGRGFYSKRELDEHYKIAHMGIKEHECELCGKAFGKKNQLSAHQRSVHKRQKLPSGGRPHYLRSEPLEIEEPQFICECSKKFYTQRDLDEHYKIAHLGVKDHVCEICGNAYGKRKQLRAHELTVHKKEKQPIGKRKNYQKETPSASNFEP